MKKLLLTAVPVLALAGVVFRAGTVYGQAELNEHPRIHAAIEALDGARTELQAAPHDFGGHKAAAIAAVNAAQEQLRLAMAYRAQVDRGHPRR